MRWQITFVSLVLGLAWALRGHFGHEHGAAWAGALGCMAALLAGGRRDWLERLPVAGALGGIGWGVGGMMSYGIVVGYGRGTDLPNVWYGLAMLAVIGGLYGFIGGGFLGLALESGDERPAQWASVISEMVAGGILAWGVLIGQFGWLMTPPRSELWAACLGAALFLGWRLYREGFFRALRLALFTATGAGLGFSIGNFLQTAGTSTGLGFNWWNVMEFTLGFGGGIGIALALFSDDWPEAPAPTPTASRIGWFFLLGGLPAVNAVQAFSSSGLAGQLQKWGLEDPNRIVGSQQFFGFGVAGLLLAVGILVPARNRASHALFWTLLLGFLILSHLRKAVFWVGFSGQPEQLLYWVILVPLVLVYRVVRRLQGPDFGPAGSLSREVWLMVLLVVIVPLLLALVSVHLHDGLPGFHERF